MAPLNSGIASGRSRAAKIAGTCVAALGEIIVRWDSPRDTAIDSVVDWVSDSPSVARTAWRESHGTSSRKDGNPSRGLCPHDTRSFTLVISRSFHLLLATIGRFRPSGTIFSGTAGCTEFDAGCERDLMICNARQKPRTHVQRDRHVGPRTKSRAHLAADNWAKHAGVEAAISETRLLSAPGIARREVRLDGTRNAAAWAASFLSSSKSDPRHRVRGQIRKLAYLDRDDVGCARTARDERRNRHRRERRGRLDTVRACRVRLRAVDAAG